jgi:3alpha(or 20beta)-hydroxysteroid dehydrogenase
MSSLEGKVILVTGAARGQGEAEARLFAERGAEVVVCDVLHEQAQQVAADIGDSARAIELDVSDPNAWQSAVEETVATFGKLTGLVNNAAIAGIKPFDELSPEDYMNVIKINQLGVFLGMKAVAEPMKAAGGGAIVNISSIAGMGGMMGGVAYCASKFAVRGMTKAVAMELGQHNIRVNSLHPGGVLTAMVTEAGLTGDVANEVFGGVPLGRIAQPREMATLAAYLLSDDSSYSTGSEFIADGGMTAGFALA